jgi:hypothetical protein
MSREAPVALPVRQVLALVSHFDSLMPGTQVQITVGELRVLRNAISESASSLEAAQKQIEHVRGGRDSAHMARKEARKDRTEAVELLQRASVYAHGLRWPQELFDAVRALLTKYENGLKLLEGPK